MVRNRKLVKNDLKNGNNETSSSSGSSEKSVGSRTFKLLSFWKSVIGFVCLVIAIYVGALGYLETRVNTPFNDEKVTYVNT